MTTMAMNWFFSDLRDKLWEVGYNISTAPVELSLKHAAKKEAARKESVKESIIATTPDYDDETSEQINQINDPLKRLVVIKAAIDANKWINWVTKYITQEDFNELPDANENEQKLVNALGLFFGFGKIYKDGPVEILEKYDSSSDVYDSSLGFMLSIKGLQNRITPEFSDMVLNKLQHIRQNATINDQDINVTLNKKFTVDDEGKIHPVFFSTSSTEDAKTVEPVKDEKMSDELFKRLEEAFKDHLSDVDHYYKIDDNGMIHLFVAREFGILDEFLVDDGKIMGKKDIYILGNIPNDTLFVPCTLSGIVSKIISSKFYTLSPEEIVSTRQTYLNDMSIYRYISFQDTSLDNLEYDKYQYLGRVLSYIIHSIVKAMIDNPNTDLPRFRFAEFVSPENFKLVSDSKVLSPMPGETSVNSCEGLEISVIGTKAVVSYYGHSEEVIIKV